MKLRQNGAFCAPFGRWFDLTEQIEGESAEQLGIEVGALGWHSLFLFADIADVFQGRWHHQSAQFELAASSRLAGGVTAGGITLLDALSEFGCRMHILRCREIWLAQEMIDDQMV
jgi:hypothetical protein